MSKSGRALPAAADRRLREVSGRSRARGGRVSSAYVNLTVKKRRKAKQPAQERAPLQLARNINEVLSMDFVSDSLSSGRRIKCLPVVDNFSKESVDITVDYGISGQYVTRVLDQVARFRG